MKLKPKIALSAKKPIKLEDKALGLLAFGHDEEPRIKNKFSKDMKLIT